MAARIWIEATAPRLPCWSVTRANAGKAASRCDDAISAAASGPAAAGRGPEEKKPCRPDSPEAFDRSSGGVFEAMKMSSFRTYLSASRLYNEGSKRSQSEPNLVLRLSEYGAKNWKGSRHEQHHLVGRRSRNCSLRRWVPWVPVDPKRLVVETTGCPLRAEARLICHDLPGCVSGRTPVFERTGLDSG